jgi:hypothetical protein
MESSIAEKNRSINIVNKCFDFDFDFNYDNDNNNNNYNDDDDIGESNDIADEYVMKLFLKKIFSYFF